MGFKIAQDDRVDAVGYSARSSAESLLRALESDWETVEFKEDPRDVYAYDETIYKVTITIEPA